MKKIPLVLLPGLLSDASVWAHQSHHLADKADIFIPDLGSPNSPQKMVEAVLTVAPPSFVLVGHSMGGWVALEVMKVAPERVKGLGLINTTAFPDNDEKRAAREAFILAAKNGKYEFIVDMLVKRSVYNQNTIAAVKAMFRKNIASLINQQTAMLARQDCTAVLKTISCPTLVIHAQYDEVFSLADSAYLAENIQSAAFSVIPDCGHMSPMESPEAVTALLEKWIA